MKQAQCPGARRRHWRQAGTTFMTIALAITGPLPPVFAAPVGGEPDPTGMPGAKLVSQLVNWLMWVSLMASLGAVLYGAAMWRGGAKLGNSPRAEDGRHYVAGGAIGALLAGLAVVLINTLFAVGRAGG